MVLLKYQSVDLSELTGSGGGGGGSGISKSNCWSGVLGGGPSGDVILSFDSGSVAGLGLSASDGTLLINTCSSHFTDGVGGQRMVVKFKKNLLYL